MHDGRGFTVKVKLSPVRWLWRERGRESDSGLSHHNLVKFTAVEAYLLSFVGRGFFSCVSVFFSLDLSKLVTSEISGLSDMVGYLGNCNASQVKLSSQTASCTKMHK